MTQDKLCGKCKGSGKIREKGCGDKHCFHRCDSVVKQLVITAKDLVDKYEEVGCSWRLTAIEALDFEGLKEAVDILYPLLQLSLDHLVQDSNVVLCMPTFTVES